MTTTIVNFDSGNVRSVMYGLARLGVDAVLTDSPEVLASADRVVFPGVGEASSAMSYLREKRLDRVIRQLKQPVLGICLGMQMLCRSSEESDAECLGLLPYKARRFRSGELKVPHTGWNQIGDLRSPLFAGISGSAYVYFVHSYFVELCDAAIATAEYGVTFSAAVAQENFFGVQFHPERSGPIGARILENFLKL